MITLIIPAHNEENRLGKTVKAYANYFPQDDILIVPNGCTDNTEKIARELSSTFKNVRVWSTPIGGKGLAVREGFKRARHEWAGFVDADLAITPKEFEKLLPHTQYHDVVIASRRVKGAVVTKKEKLSVRLASRLLNLMVRYWFRIPVRDSQCGAKLYKVELVKKFLPHCIIDKMAFDVEFLWRSRKLGANIKEVPIVWHHHEEDSKTPSALKGGFNMLGQMIRVWFS